MRGFMEKDFGTMPTLRSSENVVSFIMPDFLVRQPLTRKSMARLSEHAGPTLQNTRNLIENMNQEHWSCLVENVR